MRQVALDTLRDRLDEYVEAAEAGETVLVTARDKVVAQIGPALVQEQEPDELASEDKFADLIRRGLMTPARRPAGPLPQAPPIMPLSQLLEELDRDREDR